MRKTIYTTGEVARLCEVAPRTVSKWFDTGKLKGFRIPGGRDRRIAKADLARFMAERGFPSEMIPEVEPEAVDRVLVVGGAPSAFTESEGVEVTHVRTIFAAGIAFAEVKPTCVVVDVASIGRIDSASIAATLKGAGCYRVAVCHAVDPPDHFDYSIAPSVDPARNNIGLKTALYTASELKARKAS